MPRDAVSRTANVERTGRHKWDIKRPKRTPTSAPEGTAYLCPQKYLHLFPFFLRLQSLNIYPFLSIFFLKLYALKISRFLFIIFLYLYSQKISPFLSIFFLYLYSQKISPHIFSSYTDRNKFMCLVESIQIQIVITLIQLSLGTKRNSVLCQTEFQNGNKRIIYSKIYR